ncbi:VOC family protein [Devosia sp. WQ 349]|uniref:VOC family protein n=1 Tax=Devosia sp. WQ 349K1 TaxID=2800329 RepID=UPI0019089971|nr:VOC family protein [Devosia sp. WQ 349K1]MBK1796241.1 VOC family protein [Devosia sp. WQ 349K1]
MARVTGIGGVFFRAKDPDALSDWYETNLGISQFWQQEGGPTVFAPYELTSTYFDQSKPFMLNFRVDDLDGVIAALESNDIVVERREEWDSPDTGRFARITDPEGNPIELWEPIPELR